MKELTKAELDESVENARMTCHYSGCERKIGDMFHIMLYNHGIVMFWCSWDCLEAFMEAEK